MEKITSNPQPLTPNEMQRRGALVLRTLPALLIPFVVTLVTGLLIRTVASTQPRLPPVNGSQFFPLISIVVLVIFCTSLVILVRLRRPTLSALLLIGVWTLITTILALENGITTFWPALLILPICTAGLLIDGVASVSLAMLATVLVASIGWMESENFILTREQLYLHASNMPILFSLGFWIGLFWTVALLTSLLAGSLQQALKQSRAQEEALGQLSSQLEARVIAQTAELAQRTARAEGLYEITRALTRTLDLNRIISLIAEQAARLLRFDSTLVLLDQPKAGGFTLVAAYGEPPQFDGYLDAFRPDLRQVMEEGYACIVRLPWQEHLQDASQGVALAVPMRYGDRVTGILMLTDSQGHVERNADDLVLAAGLADQAAVAIANAQLLAESREAAMLEERTRLARDIHDTLAQGITGIVVQLGAARRALDAVPVANAASPLVELRTSLDLAQRMARESLTEARRSVWNLRAMALERGNLSDAIQSLVTHARDGSVAITFDLRGAPWGLPPDAESALLRICQEALANVSKHAAATQVAVSLEYGPQAVMLSIKDDGMGFNADILNQQFSFNGQWSGLGLLGMRERITALGGTLTLKNDGGAQVIAIISRATWDAKHQTSPIPTARMPLSALDMQGNGPAVPSQDTLERIAN